MTEPLNPAGWRSAWIAFRENGGVIPPGLAEKLAQQIDRDTRDWIIEEEAKWVATADRSVIARDSLALARALGVIG